MTKAPITDLRVVQYYIENDDGQPEFQHYDIQFQRQGEDDWHSLEIAEHRLLGKVTKFDPRKENSDER